MPSRMQQPTNKTWCKVKLQSLATATLIDTQCTNLTYMAQVHMYNTKLAPVSSHMIDRRRPRSCPHWRPMVIWAIGCDGNWQCNCCFCNRAYCLLYGKLARPPRMAVTQWQHIKEFHWGQLLAVNRSNGPEALKHWPTEPLKRKTTNDIMHTHRGGAPPHHAHTSRRRTHAVVVVVLVVVVRSRGTSRSGSHGSSSYNNSIRSSRNFTFKLLLL